MTFSEPISSAAAPSPNDSSWLEAALALRFSEASTTACFEEPAFTALSAAISAEVAARCEPPISVAEMVSGSDSAAAMTPAFWRSAKGAVVEAK